MSPDVNGSIPGISFTNEQTIMEETSTAARCQSASIEELNQIWDWNATLPEQLQGCVHDLISEIAKSQPHAEAICAWDGSFSYAELESLANEVAQRLVQQGSAPQSIVPILFSKSRWTSVAMLGAIKARCSVIALDATQPDARLQSIIQQAQPSIMLTGANHHTRAARLAKVSIISLDDTLLDALAGAKNTSASLPSASPADIVYISFTSGTTGQPKGACISHANVRSAVKYQGEGLGFTQKPRVFDFAPYSFDVAWSNFLHTLCAGGCLCVASEEDMLNDLARAITSFEATLINVTPTILRTIVSIPPTLKTVLLSGEMPYRESITKWAGSVKLLNTYGPTECTFKCAFSTLDATSVDRPDIGRGVAFSTWIVNPHDENKLCPIGATGELYLEGPLVGQGYLSDSDRTNDAFINDPPWLAQGSANRAGRSGRLYKTGDLVRYLDDGRMVFMGRKDAMQLKIRGQRVEIGDLEHHVRVCIERDLPGLPAVADAIRPKGNDSESLALFIPMKDQKEEKVRAVIDSLSAQLAERLPAFMIPNVYIPIPDLPVASTGKLNRRQLREMASAMEWSEIMDLQSTILSQADFKEPSNDVERQLCQIWSEVLGLHCNQISTSANFFRLGGDSIAAIKIVARARERNLILTVGDLFRNPLLRDAARIAATQVSNKDQELIEPFSLLKRTDDRSRICTEAASLCKVESFEIEDIYPCTPLQQGMLAMTAIGSQTSNGTRNYGGAEYISRIAYLLDDKVEGKRFQKAWEDVVVHTPILRTRIVDLVGEGLVQVVLSRQISLTSYSSFDQFAKDDVTMDLEVPLCRAALINELPRYFVLEMHHAIFDGWTTKIILESLERAYSGLGQVTQSFTPFQPFIKHVLATKCPEAITFWKDYLKGPDNTVFPSSDYERGECFDVYDETSDLRWPQNGVTPSTLVHSALSLLLSMYTNSSDIIYGTTVSGRSAPVAGIDNIAAPTIATVPFRVKMDSKENVVEFQKRIQDEALRVSEYEQLGLQDIQRINDDTWEASQFQLLLVIQPVQTKKDNNVDHLFQGKRTLLRTSVSEGASASKWALVPQDERTDSMSMFNSYGMMLICQLEDDGVNFLLNYNSGAIDEKQASRFLKQLHHLLRQLCSNASTSSTLNQIQVTGKEDIEQIRAWNSIVPSAFDESITTIIDGKAVTSSDGLAISSWDRIFTYNQLKEVSDSLARALVLKGIARGSIVILTFEKSSWMILSMIAVLKTGAIAVPVAAPTTIKRAEDVVGNLKPDLVLTSDAENASAFEGLVSFCLVQNLLGAKPDASHEVNAVTTNHPSEPAVILFTSGSTGVPKPILWNHQTLSTNVLSHAAAFRLASSNRLFQFAGYDFDVSTVEALSALCVGACLCIPSEADRRNRLADAIRESGSDWLCLTPSVADTLNPTELPKLATLVLAGERLSNNTALKWSRQIEKVYNWYGPAEASLATSCPVEQSSWRPGMSGKSSAAVTWLVDPTKHNELAPVGTIAELCIEGPILASYTGPHAASLNRNSFFTPSWPDSGNRKVPAHDRRVYKTGDLVRYDSWGNIIFIGRKEDAERKLRGQRVNLEGIELQIQAFLAGEHRFSVVAEIITLAKSTTETLALFVCPSTEDASPEKTESIIKQTFPAESLELHLLERFPSYLVPTVYVPLEEIPFSTTGKIDRKKLRQLGSTLTHEQLISMQPFRHEAKRPSTDMEKLLQDLWAEAIGIQRQIISANHNFFRLGGDSITAMRLVAMARQRGLLLTVSLIFQTPRLDEMAKQMRWEVVSTDQDVYPFALLDSHCSVDEALSYAARLCNVAESHIVDIYPCTALQEGLLALGTKRRGQYISRSVLELQPGIDPGRLERAWAATAEKIGLLRTRIVDLPKQGLVQVLLRDNPLCHSDSISAWVQKDESDGMGPGTELCRAAIAEGHFMLTIHHCTYDGNTLRMILTELESQYNNKTGMLATPFKNFIKHLQGIDSREAANFWTKQLSSLEAQQFPTLPSANYVPRADQDLEHSISLQWPRTGVTPSIILRSAWAILTSQYTSSSDVIFALTVSGRQADMKGIENCIGPTISTMPIAISIDWEETVAGFLDRLQGQMIERIPYEQYGLQNIQQPRGDLDPRLLQTLLVVQPIPEGNNLDKDSLLFKARNFSANIDTLGIDPFNSYAMMVVCELGVSGLRLRLSFDSNVMPKEQVGRVAHQFETVIRQICSKELAHTKLDTIQVASEGDLDLFWSQNSELPPESESLVPAMIHNAALEHPEKVVIDAWDGQMTYKQVDDLSTRLAKSLVHVGVRKGSVVALHFEKSKWVPLVQLAVFKAGAVEVQLSVSVPDLRVARVFQNLGVEFAVASTSLISVVAKFARGFTVEELLLMSSQDSTTSLPVIEKHDPAAILVSSGSTGEPKQVLWSHKGIAANIKAHGDFLQITPSSRIFQFASYDFDVSTIESMSALSHKACLCIPSESERLNEMASTINHYNVNFINITPSTAKAIQPEDVPGIAVLVLSGENLLQEHVDRWKGKCVVLNWYGAAEHPSTVCDAVADSWHSGVIGSLQSIQPTLSWLIDARNSNRLVPYGAVGEIASEGPLSSDGYVANPTLNERRFRDDPAFLLAGNGRHFPGRRGQIFCSGDLGQYDNVGNLVYMGRKDSQVKIRGQLVAPEEVQHQIRKNLTTIKEISVVVDAIKIQNSSSTTLVAFLDLATEDEVEQVTAGLNEKLKRVLPPYAIPVYYIPVTSIPKNASAKIDRARLREIGSSYDPSRQVSESQRRAPTTQNEILLCELWSQVLGISSSAISANDSFLQLGDSIQAMRLVGVARQQNLSLTVAGIFEQPILEDMATHLVALDEAKENEAILPFSLISSIQGDDTVKQQAASLCGVATEDIEDLFPCTPLQEGLLALTLRRDGDYIGNTILQIAPFVSVDKFVNAWYKTISALQILRTRIIDLPGHGLLQAVIEGHSNHIEAESISQYLEKQRKLPMDLGTPLMQWGIFTDKTVGVPSSVGQESEYSIKSNTEVKGIDKDAFYFVLTLHHSIYDGITTPLVIETLENFYNQVVPVPHVPFQSFIKFIGDRDTGAEAKYWKSQFKHLTAPQFPTLPSSIYQPQTDSTLLYTIENLAWRGDNITPSTVVRAALALLCFQHSNSFDVVFGEVTSGRKIAMAGIERLVGPTIATVPIRVRIENESTISRFLASLQTEAIKMIPYEQTGLSTIRQFNEETERACQFQTLLVVQMPESSTSATGNGIFTGEVRRTGSEDDARYHGFQTYPLSFICTPDASQLDVRLCFDSRVIDHGTAKRMSQDFEQLVRRLVSSELDKSPVGDITATRDQDVNQVWQWNATEFDTTDKCIHDVFSQRAQTKPDSKAVCAWDGELSYGALDRLSSRVASRLRSLGLHQGTVVPLFFEKSMYAVVAFLGVSKAGCAAFPVDTTLPKGRLESSLTQMNPGLCLSSPSNATIASQLLPNVLILGPDSKLFLSATDSSPDNNSMAPFKVEPSAPVHIGLVGGSTVDAKCYALDHRNLSSAVEQQQKILQLGESIVYDSSTDPASLNVWSVIQVLSSGGTLCIPSETEVESEFEEVLHKFGVTDMILTPSVAQTLDPANLPTLRRVYLGGDQVTKHDVARWTSCIETFVAYGVGESCGYVLYHQIDNISSPRLAIGKGVGVSTWVLDPEKGERLVPVGTVGELYLEGPLLGTSYLDNDTGSASLFIEAPSWLMKGSPDGSVPGRRNKLLKTGDLVKYDPSDGVLIFVSTTSSQAMLQGQRIDLIEVEHHVRQYLTQIMGSSAVAAEVITPLATGRPILVIFVEHKTADFSDAKGFDRIEGHLREKLPSHMIPSAYIAVDSIPVLLSGKPDRKRVQDLGARLTVEQLASGQNYSKSKAPESEAEKHLQQLWVSILGVSSDKIRSNSSFIRLGGDSIAAMRLAALSRAQGLSLTVQSILQKPRLADMSNAMTSILNTADNAGSGVPPPFSLMKFPAGKEEAIVHVSKHCQLDIAQIQDIFPCTSVQKSLLSMTAKSENSYVARYCLRLAPDVDLERFQDSWRDVSRVIAPILRCRIVDIPTEGLVHVQVDEPIEWHFYEDIDAYFSSDEKKPMGLGTPLTRLSIVKNSETQRNWCYVTQHHAIYDGYSVGLLLREITKAYTGVLDDRPIAPFQAFISHIGNVNKQDAIEFWASQFAGSEAIPFPELPAQDYRPKADSTVNIDIKHLKWQERDATPSTMIKAAWSILTSRYTGSDDVLFGAMVSGRQIPLNGIERMIAPLISAVPVRVHFNPKDSVDVLLQNIQSQSLATIEYEQTELLDIRRINSETEIGTRFNTLLVVNPPEQVDYLEQGPFQHETGYVSNRNGLDDFNPNAVMIMCQLNDTDSLQLEISFDSNVISVKQMERMMAQFEHILRQIIDSASSAIEDISVASNQDIRDIWSWNETLPEPVSSCVHSLITETAKQQPNAPAICAWDGDLSYSELDTLSNFVAAHLSRLGAGPGSVIPLCFEKSKWYPVAALGAIKAGAACVALDSTQPELRLKSILQQIGPTIVLSSVQNMQLAGQLSDANTVVIGQQEVEEYSQRWELDSLSEVSPSDVLYVVFTSGSTGVPKGIVTTHQNFASASLHQADVLHIKPGTRVFDFVSYSFDVSWSNHLQTLIRGGCLCIPSEQQRRNDIPGAFNSMNCNYSYFTPSVAKSLNPSSIPGLRTLAMGGEPIQSSEISRWTQAETIIGIYGPAECAQALSFVSLTAETPNHQVGHCYGARAWLVEPGRPDRLAAIGTIAELAIEGPTVSKGYFNDPERTASTYLQDLSWLASAPEGHTGRAGVVYITGDLLRYNYDGSLEFIGRKDGMIKLRGQRIELTEVEYHAKSSLRSGLCDGVVAEIIQPKNSKSPLLALFFSASSENATDSGDQDHDKVSQIMEDLEEQLWDRLPQYMVPSAYIHVDEIPMTTTNKTDRRAIRAIGNAMTLEQLGKLQSRGKTTRPPSTYTEKCLQTLWAFVLDLEPENISAESSFLRIGGESIAAMRLVAKAREQGLSITVADIFKAPRLMDQALLIQRTVEEDKASLQLPFSLLEHDQPSVFVEEFVEPSISSNYGRIADVLPVTDFQSLAISQALQDPPSRLPHWIIDLPADVDFAKLKQACVALVRYYDILHTVFISVGGRLLQALLPDMEPEYDDIDAGGHCIDDVTQAICEQDLKRPRHLGQSLIRFIAIRNGSGGHKLVFRISHAQFDGYSWDSVLHTLSAIYGGSMLSSRHAFAEYIAFTKARKATCFEYWSVRLQGSHYPEWSTSDSSDRIYDAKYRLTMRETLPMPDVSYHDGISTATLFHAACAVALSRQFQCKEVVFGRLVTGRSMLPGHLQDVVGPTMTEIPIRTSVNDHGRALDVARQLQTQFIEDAGHEAVGMTEIIENCTSWPDHAKDFGWRTSFQQAEDGQFTFLGSLSKLAVHQRQMPPRSRPEIYATPKNGALEIEIEANSKLVSEGTMVQFLYHLREVLGECH